MWIGNYLHSRSIISPDSVAIVDIDDNIEYSYKDLERRANNLAYTLVEKYNIKKGDRVAFVSRNRVELIDSYYATAKTGSILVPYNARLKEEELNKLVKKEKPKIIFYEANSYEKIKKVKEQNSEIKLVCLKDETGVNEGVQEYNDIIIETDNLIYEKDLDIEDIHLIIHTGGTTGLPKGALVSHRNELFNSFNEICSWGLNYSDSTLLLLPLFHTGGWNLLTLPLLHVGGKIYLTKQFCPKKTLEIIDKEKITVLFGAATIFRMVLAQKEFEATDLSSLKWVMAGAAPTPYNIMEAFWDRGVKFVLGYGMTEAGPNNISSVAHFMSDKEVRQKFASVGKPMYMTVAKIVDDEGKEIKNPNEEGELLFSGPQIFSGYWENEEETKETLVDNFVHTGDMAMFDEDGYYYIVGRKKNMFISGGENVFPPEIETALYEVEGINEVCVFGVEDEKWGEVGKAVISLKDGADINKEKILDELKGKLAKFKIPKYVKIVDEIEKNSVGKIVVSKIIQKHGGPCD